MNLLHMKYALEVAKAGSVNKAAEELLIAQPNLSRAIKELEQSLGIAIFDRSARGMRLTPDGEVFVNYAGSILKQVDEVEELFLNGAVSKERFSISVPRASYISEAFTRFSQCLMDVPKIEVFYKETNALRALNNVLQEDYKLGIVRYAEEFDRYYKSMMDAKDLNYELVTEFQYVLIMSRNNPLARLKTITYDDLSDYIEIAHADPFVPSLPMSEVKRSSCPIRSTAAYSCSSAPASSSCSRTTSAPSCGCRPCRTRIWSTTAWCSASAAKTSAPTRTL